jgi:C-terminal processing protease CtpA/Prc
MNDPEWSQEDKQWAKESFEKLEKRLGEFVNLSENAVTENKLEKVYEYPKNVGIIINGGNGSTTEQFLLAAKQSKKVKLFGTTTAGILDISNMNFVTSPCSEFELGYCISKSLRIPDMAIDDKGIQPDYYIDNTIPKYKWIDYVQDTINQ